MNANLKTIVLTIGMIVKNEEKVLKRCLDSVKKLMDKVPCELIITDTGSTDKTLEIASQYDATIQNFEWCNDFAAARNCATNVAQGKWFMQFDADEWLSDEIIDEIASFLKSKNSDKYNCAKIVMRNYTDVKFKNYVDVPLIRFFKTKCGIKFESKIHEFIAPFDPTYHFKSICNHSGYCYENDEVKQKKEKRNNLILREHLKSNPDDLRMLLSFSALCKYEEGLTTLLHLDELIQKTSAPDYYKVTCFRIMQYYISEGHHKRAIEKGNEFLEKHSRDTTDEMDIHYYMTIGYLNDENNNNYDKVIYHAKKYDNLYKRYLKGERNNGEIFSFYDTATSDFECTVLICLAKVYAKQEKASEAFDVLLKTDVKGLTDVRIALLSKEIFEIGKNSEVGRELAVHYMLFKDVDVLNNWQDASTYFVNAPQSKQKILAEKLCAAAPQSPLADVIYKIANGADAQATIQKAKDENLNVLSIYAAIVLNGNIDFAVENKTKEQIVEIAFAFNALQNDLFDFAIKHVINYNYQNIEGAIFASSIAELALNYTKDKLLPEKMMLVALFINSLYVYAQNVFINLSDETLNVIPEVYRFAVKIKNLTDTRALAGTKEYISGLKDSLLSCPTHKTVIEILLEEAQEEIEKASEAKSEFDMLADKIKLSINELLAKGQKAEALGVLTQLEAIMPNDKDITALKEKCQ